MFTPMISIVMPSYQQAAYVEEAVRSVLDQDGVDVELLVMDPGSTDNTREILQSLQKEYGGQLQLHFSPDSGQSDAVNRGMRMARGTVLGWLNSDDRLRPGALARIAPYLMKDEPAWLYGIARMVNAEGGPSQNLASNYKIWRGRTFSRLKLLTENFVPQQATFWNRAMWDIAGELDINLHLDMDYDLWLRFSGVADPIVLSDHLADFRIHATAKGSLQTGRQLSDAFATARRHAAGLGFKGAAALLVHRIFSVRTRIVYHFMKPGQ